jgi:hypothetical protein
MYVRQSNDRSISRDSVSSPPPPALNPRPSSQSSKQHSGGGGRDSSSSGGLKAPRLVCDDPRPMANDAAFVVWQLLDSNLPTGGFAHSYGLEAALQLGQFGLTSPEEPTRVEGLLRFCRQLLRQQALLLLPLVRAGAHAAAAGALGDPGVEEEGAAWWRGVEGKDGEHPTLARWAHLDLQCHVRTYVCGPTGWGLGWGV